MKPIKKGMTEAVTRDGRKVTQLTWFEVDSYYDYSCAGVLGGEVLTWTSSGSYIAGCEEDHRDIFAPVEYEWQWLIKNDNGSFSVSAYRQFDLSIAGNRCCNIDADDYKGDARDNAIWYSRIEESKREVK